MRHDLDLLVPRPRPRRPRAALAAAALLLAACGDPDVGTDRTDVPPATESTTTAAVPEPTPFVSFTVADHLVEPPAAPVRPGVVTLELINNGQDFHHLQVWRVDDAATVAAAIEAGDLGALAGGRAVGGLGAIEGGGTVGTLATELDAGEYVTFCVIHTPAGAHNELGMVATFEVAGQPNDVELPSADATLTITPYGFELPGDWDGVTPLRVVNANEFPADAEFLKLAPGATRDDFFAFIDGGIGPPPFTVAGGVSGLGPSGASVVLDGLAPGNYLVASFQPDPTREMVPQFLTGYLAALTVA